MFTMWVCGGDHISHLPKVSVFQTYSLEIKDNTQIYRLVKKCYIALVDVEMQEGKKSGGNNGTFVWQSSYGDSGGNEIT